MYNRRLFQLLSLVLLLKNNKVEELSHRQPLRQEVVGVMMSLKEICAVSRTLSAWRSLSKTKSDSLAESKWMLSEIWFLRNRKLNAVKKEVHLPDFLYKFVHILNTHNCHKIFRRF